MMLATILLAAALAKVGDPIDARYASFLRTGCIEGPPVPALESDEGKRVDELPRLEDMPMSGQSLRFVIAPDSYLGDGLLMVQIDSGLRRSMGADGEPFFLATVGKWGRTCTIRVPLHECPQAIEVRDRLTSLQIPLGHGFEELDRITLHSTQYSIQFYGSEPNRLSYFTPGNPLEEPLEEAKEALRECWRPALESAIAPIE